MINMEAKTSVSDSTGSSDTTVSTVTPTGADRQKPEAPKDNQEPNAPDEAPKAPDAPAVDWEKRYKDTQRALQEANEKLKASTKTEKKGTKEPDSKVITQDEIRALEQQYAESGSLSEESYKDLESRGYPKEVVDDIIEARKVKAERLKNDTLSVIDSDTGKATEAYNTMIDWAKDNFSDEEAAEYDKMISSGSLMQTKSAVSYLLQRYLAAAPKAPAPKEAPSPTKGDASVPPSADSGAYRSMAEMRKDLKDTRYQKDPAFRAMVDQKTLKAKSMGVL